MGAGWGILNKVSPVFLNHFNHCMVRELGPQWYISNCSTFPPRFLQVFAPSKIIEDSIISSRPDTPLVIGIMHVPCHDPQWTIGGGLASTTQEGIDAPDPRELLGVSWFRIQFFFLLTHRSAWGKHLTKWATKPVTDWALMELQFH